MATHTQRGSQFEEEVRQLLQLKGYSVVRNELINGTQIDLVARKNDLFDNLCLVVECTDRAEPVGVDLVKQKASVLLSLHDSKHLFRLIYVARNGFTAEAKAFADAQPTVILLTLNDLESQLIDFRRYADWYLSNYETSSGFFSEGRLYGSYVELTARDRRGVLIPILTEEVRRWLGDSSNNLLFLLGEYGSGKTSFCRHLVYELLTEKFHDQGKQKLTPILFNLREYRKAFSIQQLVTDALVNQYGLELRSFMAFERICTSGRVLLVLDGFDEMADKSDKRTLAECFRQIYTLASLNAKIIVSCRSNFFQSNMDVIDLLKQFSIEIPYGDGSEQRVTRLSFGHQGTILTIEKFNDQQIREYIQNRFGTEADAIYSSIRAIHDLSDLSTRPVLLDMVLSTLPELSASKKRINSAALYEHYTDRWTARDEWRVTAPLKVRQQFSEILAWHMHYNSLSDISYHRLEQAMVRALEHFADSNEQLEAFKNDIQTCSFLIRAHISDTFRFAHKSFVEFFVARKLAANLTNGAAIEKPEREDPKENIRLSDLLTGYRMAMPTFLIQHDMFTPATQFKFWPDQLSSRVIPQRQFGETFMSKLEQEIRAVFENKNPSAPARAFSISEEIATFALEHFENMAVSLSDILSKTVEENSLVLLSEIFRLGKATELVRRNQGPIQDYILGDGHELLKASFCAALTRLPGAVNIDFLQQTRSRLSPEGWSYFLVELASQSEYRSLMRQCFQRDDLRTVDQIICAHALYNTTPTSEHDTVTESLILKLLESDQLGEINLGLTLFPYLYLLSENMNKSAIRAYRNSSDRKVKEEILSVLCSLGGEKTYRTLRSLSYEEQDPSLKKRLIVLEREARDVENREKMRQSWDQAKAHRQVKEQIWKSLRR